ncbi:MAG TPA: hypothetical protein VNQ73_23150 [Ilumatobacter sp.]|nr:hypothetical protein [Ilumatobacter sp.]
MTQLVFAKAFRRHVTCPDAVIEQASTVGAAFAGYFELHPAVRSYVLDDAGRIRRHVTLFVDGEQVTHVDALTTPVTPTSTIHVFQALSGG